MNSFNERRHHYRLVNLGIIFHPLQMKIIPMSDDVIISSLAVNFFTLFQLKAGNF